MSLPPLHLHHCHCCIYVAPTLAPTSLPPMQLNCSCRCTHIAAAVAFKLLPPSHLHCCCLHVHIAVAAQHSTTRYVDTTSITKLLPESIQMHSTPTNRIVTPKIYQKIAPNAPKVTGVVFLHPPVSSNAIGVLKCTLFVSLIIQVSHCIFNFLYKVDTTHDILFCSNSYPRTRPMDWSITKSWSRNIWRSWEFSY